MVYFCQRQILPGGFGCWLRQIEISETFACLAGKARGFRQPNPGRDLVRFRRCGLECLLIRRDRSGGITQFSQLGSLEAHQDGALAGIL